ncbi:MAG: MBOAT family protein [Flexilinea sp.]
MAFSTFSFLFLFLPIFLLFYFCCPSKNINLRNAILLIGSVIFYAWGEPINVILMVLCIGITFGLSFFISKRNKPVLIISILINLLPLLIYKYTSFFLGNINLIFNTSFVSSSLPLPVGISFYTFKVITYIADLYRGRVKLQRNPFLLALYVFLFPQIMAGPIVRYLDFEKQIVNRKTTWETCNQGIRRFIFGLAKMMLIANQAGTVVSTIRAQDPTAISAWMWWFCSLAYGVQIYFDFSGYSDMAIGLGNIFGFKFSENFNKPYKSHSITEFWRRWHISLSSFFRDYIFIPLDRSRIYPGHHIVNLLIVWLLTGLWHGAYWNYVLWGLYYFIFLLLEKYIFGRWLRTIPSFFSWLITFVICIFGWALFMFESNSLIEIGEYLSRYFIFQKTGNQLSLRALSISGNSIIVFAGFILSVFPSPAIIKKINKENTAVFITLKNIFLLFLLLVSIFFIDSESFNPFIYFNF